MKKTDKLDFIFQTGKRLRFYMDSVVSDQLEGSTCIMAELSNVQMKVAMQIHVSEPVSLSDLATNLGVSNPSASVIVEKLVEKKIISRDPDPQDRRRVQLTIHPDAREELEQMHHRFHQAFQKIASKLGGETIERWYQVAEKITDVLQEEDPRP